MEIMREARNGWINEQPQKKQGNGERNFRIVSISFRTKTKVTIKERRVIVRIGRVVVVRELGGGNVRAVLNMKLDSRRARAAIVHQEKYILT